ncbi:hypothetical protein LPJ61_006691 [Coemansia biformis]|uniref:Uncharacterized protein n=1 Tax=Coemansia biformis TaxID=1286918 RepID=A0A9W7XSQ8_9FUNG|nr:hypothetical protein LPJ61_006691 [Coemansia biformis]
MHRGISTDELPDTNRYLAYLLHIGELANGADNKLRIPNGRLRRMWEHVRLQTTFGDADQIGLYAERLKLVDSLNCGDASVLRYELELAVTELLHDDSGYSEGTMLEAACRYITSILTLPCYLATSRSNIEYDYSFFQELHSGRSSWWITLLPFGRYTQRLVVLFEFARIAPEVTSDEAAALLARQALQTITDNEHARPFSHCDNRLDVGVAIGQSKVVINQRYWKRVDNGCPVTCSSMPIEQWEQNPDSAGSTGWHDGLGWTITNTIDDQ